MKPPRVVISYPADLSAWGRDQLDTPWVRAHVRQRFAGATPGDQLEVFLDVGCCGDTLDVPLRLERRDGPVGPDTGVEYVERAACGLAGGWLVQSRAGPVHSR